MAGGLDNVSVILGPLGITTAVMVTLFILFKLKVETLGVPLFSSPYTRIAVASMAMALVGVLAFKTIPDKKKIVNNMVNGYCHVIKLMKSIATDKISIDTIIQLRNT